MKTLLKILLMISVAWASLGQVGCASGGYKLTRQYARFVNQQNVVLRVVLYLLTSVVFVATLLIDAVIFNTMDFWQGRVSANTYHFEQDGKLYVVKHSYQGEDRRRNTEIQVIASPGKINETVERTIRLTELSDGHIGLFENGVLKTQVDDVKHFF